MEPRENQKKRRKRHSAYSQNKTVGRKPKQHRKSDYTYEKVNFGSFLCVCIYLQCAGSLSILIVLELFICLEAVALFESAFRITNSFFL